MSGGKSGTTTQSVSIPPEVLARYNSVNARAEGLADRPFQPYGGQFVAPLTAQQQAGMANIDAASGLAQGAFNQAQGYQTAAYNQAMPYLQNAINPALAGMTQASNQFGQAQGYLNNAASQGQYFGSQAYQPIAGALGAATPYMQTATQLTGGGLGAAAPMMGAAEGFLGGGTQAVNPQEFGQAQINKYMSPYMRNVVEAQQALQQQESAAQRSALSSQAIGAGAFGGDRAGIAQANLARQQLMANQATLGNLLQQGYGQAAGMFSQQQGVDLAAQQANRQAQQFGSQQAANLAQQRYAQQMGAGQQMAALGQQQFGMNVGQGQALAGLGQQMYQQGLGSAQAAQGLGAAQYGMGAQQAGLEQGLGSAMFGMGSQQALNAANLGAQQQAAALQGAQAQIGAGTLEQQTRQAEMTAQYQQFLQERGYDFQVAQFLANIAMGTGALSGSTTTTTQPMPFMSDRRTKKDIKEIGETHDGLPIYSFKYKQGDEQPRIGVMADEVREKHPDAVSRHGGIDAVDYEKVANRAASEGGGVMPHRAGQGYVRGGVVSDQDLATILAMQKDFLGPYDKGGIYGQSQHSSPGAGGIVPQKSVHVSKLQGPTSAPRLPESGFGQAYDTLKQAESAGDKLFGDKGLLTSRGLPSRTFKSISGSETKTDQNAPKSDGGIGAAAPAKIAETSPKLKEEDKNFFDKIGDWWGGRQYGGGVRPVFKQGGASLNEDVLPYQSELGYGPEDVNESESDNEIKPLEPGKAPGQSGGSGLGNLSSAIGLAGTVASAGSKIASAVPAILAALPFSDERVKNNMERVGKLDNGQPVYKYSIGNGPTQLGLSAQNVSEYGDPSAVYRDQDGFLHLDYDRAAKNYGGGIRPAFQQGGKNDGMSDLEYAIRTAAAETSGDPEETRGIAHVIHNRLQSGQYGKSYRDVVLAPKQFEPWSTTNNNPMNISPEDRRYQEARAAFEEIQQGKLDPRFENVQNFWGPRSQYALGREAPSWGRVGGLDLGGTRFHTLDEVAQSRRDIQPREFTGAVPRRQNIGGLEGARASFSEPRRQVAGAESITQGGSRQDYVDGAPISSGGIEPPMEFRSGKPFKSWGDFATSRQFLIPFLSGLGGMARSKSLYLGPAILEGLGAAAESYAGMEQPVTQGEERRALTATAAETAKKVAQETELLETGLYEKKWIPGVGWWVYDKSKPYDPGKRITDSQMNPIGGVKLDINKIPTAPDSAKPTQTPSGATPGAAPSGGQAPPTGAEPSGPPTGGQALQNLDWKATTDIPQGYVPPNQFNLEMDPESKQREQNIAAPMIRQQRERAGAANRELYRLDEMTQAFNTLPPNGLLTPGQYAAERVNFVKSLNTISQVAGGKPLWDPTQLGAAEQLAKDAFRLGQQAASSAGTVAGRDIIEQSVVATPGMELTAAGFRRVAAGMRMAAQYEIDKAKFLDSYSGQWGHLSGAEELFNKLNPPSEYARKAVISTIDPALMQRINSYVAQYKDRPLQEIVAQLSPSIDRLYGAGVTAKILGAK